MSYVRPSTLYNSKKFTTFIEALNQIPDCRLNRNKLHCQTDIIVLIVIAILGGANNPSEIKRFGERHKKKLRYILNFEHGISSRQTINRVLEVIDPKQLSYWLNFWCYKYIDKNDVDHIAIDGKEDTACGFECMRAYDVKNCIVIAHEPVRKGTNEITTAPILLNKLDLKNKIVSADAIITQKKIAYLIVTKGADYVLALKRNHGQLYEDVKLYLETMEQNPELKGTFKKHETVEKGHGRFERRVTITTDKIEWLTQRYQWKGLKSLSMITRTRESKDKIETEQCLFISTLDADPVIISTVVRGHWGIENLCHRDLDMNFESDRSLSRTGHAPFNIAILKDFVLGLLKQVDSDKTIREKRLDNAHSLSILLKTLLNR